MSDSAFSAIDHEHMAQALRLAERGLFTTQPNPRVGCVVVRDGQVAGTGYHQRAGEPHAEVFALREAGERARGATAYVTLEPCAHQGRTPPCTDALIAAGVGRVVIASEDPFPQVNGRGIDQLRAAGIAVQTGLLHEAARELNVGFFSRIERGRPFVRVKLAMSLDGRTALSNGRSKWISGEAAREDAQRWRARSSAILTGSGTVLADDPALTVRLPGEWRQPRRVVVDSSLRTPPAARILKQPGETHIATVIADSARQAPLAKAGAKFLALSAKDGHVDLVALMHRLAELECNEVLVEAGAGLNGALLQGGLMDECIIYMAPRLLGDSARGMFHLPALKNMRERIELNLTDVRRVGNDLRILARPIYAS